MKKHRSFNDILADLETVNSKQLMKRARVANRLAKTLRGRQRQNAYGVKSRALGYLVEHLPDQTAIRKDIILTDFVVVELKGAETGLHFPVDQMTGGAAR